MENIFLSNNLLFVINIDLYLDNIDLSFVIIDFQEEHAAREQAVTAGGAAREKG
jgi:hypothetical protein